MGIAKLMLYPQPNVGGVLRVRYHQRPPTLVSSAAGAGEETTPSKVPEEFHWSLLLPGAVYQALQKDQRVEDAQSWYSLWQAGLSEFRDYVNNFVPQGPLFDEEGDDFLVLDSDTRGRF
jgi:hypothetical protein